MVAINLTLDGFCDHTAVNPDEEVHDFFTKIFDNVEISIMGRITYQLMDPYWSTIARNQIGSPAEIRFAERFDQIHKILVSKTIDHVDWVNTEIIHDNIKETVIELKNGTGKDILIGGTTLISYLTKENLIDEFIFVIHPIIFGKGKRLFSESLKKVNLKLIKTTTFGSGAIALHYKVIS